MLEIDPTDETLSTKPLPNLKMSGIKESSRQENMKTEKKVTTDFWSAHFSHQCWFVAPSEKSGMKTMVLRSEVEPHIYQRTLLTLSHDRIL